MEIPLLGWELNLNSRVGRKNECVLCLIEVCGSRGAIKNFHEGGHRGWKVRNSVNVPNGFSGSDDELQGDVDIRGRCLWNNLIMRSKRDVVAKTHRFGMEGTEMALDQWSTVDGT